MFISVGSGLYPYNTDVVYKTELVDTHNAMDPESGTFHAPFAGTYGFMFYALIGINVIKLYSSSLMLNLNKLELFYNL